MNQTVSGEPEPTSPQAQESGEWKGVFHVDPGHYLDILVVSVEGDPEQGEDGGGGQQALAHRHDALLRQQQVAGELHHIHREVGEGEAVPGAVARHFA